VKKKTVDTEIYLIGENSIFNDFKKATVEECFEYCSTKKLLGLDIETTKKYNRYGEREGLDPYLSKIVMFQIGDTDRQYIIDCRNTDISILKPVLEDINICIVGHNLKFEYKHIFHNYGIILNNLYDTQICEQILYNGYDIKFSLEELLKRYFNTTVDKSTRLAFLDIGSRAFSKKEILYGAEDIIYPLKIREIQIQESIKKTLDNCVSLEMQFIPVLGNIEYKGLYLDREKWLEVYEKNIKKLKEYEDILNNIILSDYSDTEFVNRQYSLFNEGLTCGISWNSSKQVIEFFKYLGVCPQEISKTTHRLDYTVEAKVLKASLFDMNKDISEKYKNIISIYITYKEYAQACSTFGKAFLEHINPITGRVHTNYWQILNTGRISSSNPNLQNIPADESFRKCFTAQEGNCVINADYSGQETVILANVSQESNIIELINTGGDMHCFVTRSLNLELKNLSDDDIKKYHKDKRQIAKAAGFAIQYGGTGFTISKNLSISPEEGETVYNAYYKAFPTLKKFFDRTIALSMKNGFIEIDPISKRKFFFEKMDMLSKFKDAQDWKQYYKLKGKYERACLNYIIQGAAGSVTKLAAIYYHNWIKNSGYINDVFITNLVHDEINVECKKEYSEIAAKELENCMKRAGDVWCKTVPLNATAVIGEYWGH
jgi:DNA polymerase-1